MTFGKKDGIIDTSNEREDKTMTKYYVIACNGFQSSIHHRNYADAKAAADRRHAISGQTWIVKEIWLNNPYADEERPYKAKR